MHTDVNRSSFLVFFNTLNFRQFRLTLHLLLRGSAAVRCMTVQSEEEEGGGSNGNSEETVRSITRAYREVDYFCSTVRPIMHKRSSK